MTYHKACYFDVQPLLDRGWRPRYSNIDMLKESYDWFLSHCTGRNALSASPHRTPLRQRILRSPERARRAAVAAWHQGELYPRVGSSGTKLTRPNRG